MRLSTSVPVIAGTDVPGASTEAGHWDRHSRTAQDSRSALQQQQASTATEQEQLLTTAPHERLAGLCRKPGRGDTTLSMSCSDKLARWDLLGVQVGMCGLLTWGCIQTCCNFVASCVCVQTWASLWVLGTHL